jgi:anti-sigma regulatory factor (Ser/Thr protein kinase)
MSQNAPDLEISLPARPENVAILRHVLGGIGDALGIDAESLADLRLAVSEACSNVVVHAYPGEEEGLMDFDVTVSGERTLDVVVRDHGRGMAPRADSPGLGVGLPLIATLTQSLQLTAGPDGGTEVHMTFGWPEVGSAAAPVGEPA